MCWAMLSYLMARQVPVSRPGPPSRALQMCCCQGTVTGTRQMPTAGQTLLSVLHKPQDFSHRVMPPPCACSTP